MKPAKSSLAAIVAAAVALALYVPRLCPTLALQGDSVEIVTAAAVWGVPHAPGYPALTLVGHLMTKLPFGEIAWRVHLTSALFHAGAVLAVGLFVARATRSAPAVAASCGALGLSRAFLVSSLYVEVFPLNDLLFAVVLLLAYEAGRAEADDSARRWFVHLAWISGLAAAHHPMIVFGAPAVFVLAGERLVAIVRGRPRVGLSLAGAVVLPIVASYALVPLAAARDGGLSWGDVRDLGGLVRLVLRLDYGGPLHAALHEAPPDVQRRLAHWGASIVRSATPLPLSLAAVGLVLHGRRRGGARDAVALSLAVLVPGPVFAAMNVHFQATEEERVAIAERFTTMSMIPIATAVGLAIGAAGGWLQERLGARAGRAAIAAAAALPLVVLAPEARALDLSADRRGLAYAHDLVRSTSDDALVLVGGDLAAPAVLYVCLVERACKERIVVTPGLLSMPWYRRQVARREPALGALPASVREIHELVDAQIGSRRVYALPGVVLKDPVLAHRYAVEPALLMLRIPGDDAKDARDEAVAWAKAIAADGGACAGCTASGGALLYPTMQVSVVKEYASALKNHAVVAREAGDLALAAELDRRSDVFARESSLPRRGPVR